MTHRLALAIASLAAAATLAVALAVAGFTPPSGDPAVATGGDPAGVVSGAAPSFQVDTIYVAPAAPDQMVTIEGSGDHERGEADDQEAAE